MIFMLYNQLTIRNIDVFRIALIVFNSININIITTDSNSITINAIIFNKWKLSYWGILVFIEKM